MALQFRAKNGANLYCIMKNLSKISSENYVNIFMAHNTLFLLKHFSKTVSLEEEKERQGLKQIAQ